MNARYVCMYVYYIYMLCALCVLRVPTPRVGTPDSDSSYWSPCEIDQVPSSSVAVESAHWYTWRARCRYMYACMCMYRVFAPCCIYNVQYSLHSCVIHTDYTYIAVSSLDSLITCDGVLTPHTHIASHYLSHIEGHNCNL